MKRKKVLYPSILTVSFILCCGCGQNLQEAQDGQPYPGQWSVEKANAWYAKQPWIVGCNYVPSTAINDVEFWQSETFDVKTIEKELALAREWGMNSVRVFLNYVVWEAEPESLKKNFRTFLKLAEKQGISVMPVLFDDCNFSGAVAKVGKQPDPIPGIHNSGWVSSPPRAMVTDPDAFPKLKAYLQDMVKTFRKDKRIIMWDLYNEPANAPHGDKCIELVKNSFQWAREMKPSQPLTIGLWADFFSELSQLMLDMSDITSFHTYDGVPVVEAKIKRCTEGGRPVVCTEWLFRQAGITPQVILPVFKEHKVGAYNWGLVEGRTQTYYHFGSRRDTPKPSVWQLDLVQSDGTPYREAEFFFFRHIIFGEKAPEEPQKTDIVLLPISQTWKYTENTPPANWFDINFPDADWQTGNAPFGKEEMSIWRNPNTEWLSKAIWLRTTFDLTDEQLNSADKIILLTHYDDDTYIYINGHLAIELPGYNAIYEEIELSPEAIKLLKPGTNTIAVSVINNWGGQFFDMGLVKQILQE